MRLAVLGLLWGGLAGCAVPLHETLWTGAYKDVALGLAPGTAAFGSPPWLARPRRGEVLIWAFATGECGQERWGDVDTPAFAAANLAAMERDGRDFVVSTGGEAGIFTCGSAEGMLRFVERYLSPRLAGLDFDIEGRQSAEQIDALVRHAAEVHRRWPHLRLSFTLATHAAGDGSRRSLNATGETVLRALGTHGLDDAVVNLMVMNYGPADTRWCMLAGAAAVPRCDMGRSALQAARNVHEKYGIALHRIALTLMLGENDVAGNVTTPADAQAIAVGARSLGLAGLHYWSLDRDQPCASGSARVSPRCHGLPGVPAGRFGAVLGATP